MLIFKKTLYIIMKNSRNMTGLYVSGFIREGYLPPQEKRSTIPSTLYRGHVVKLARRPTSNPHRNSVGRYPMHSLNSGFNGVVVPLKDRKNFERFSKTRDKVTNKNVTYGKWTNFPMLVEMRKVGGTPVPEPFLNKNNFLVGNLLTIDSDQQPLPSRQTKRFTSAGYYHDKGDDIFYQSMYKEIESVVAKQSEIAAANHSNLKRLLNSYDDTLAPQVTAALQPSKRASTSVGYSSKALSTTKTMLPQRPFTSANSSNNQVNSTLLLPVPYVSQYNIVEKVSNSRHATPIKSLFLKSKSNFTCNTTPVSMHPGVWHNAPSRHHYLEKKTVNIGMTSAQKVHHLLSVSN